MLTRLACFARGLFARLVPARPVGLRLPGDDPGGAGVTANLAPRTPILVGGAARSIPPDEE